MIKFFGITFGVLFLVGFCHLVMGQSDMDEVALMAQIRISYHQDTYQPSKKEPIHSESQTEVFKSDLICHVMTFRVKTLVSSGKRTANCSASTHCPVLQGSNKYSEYNDKGEAVNVYDFPIEVVSNSNTIKDERSGNLGISSEYTAAGKNVMDAIGFEIKPYEPGGMQITPLTPYYVIWLTGNLGFDFKNPGKVPTGDGSGKYWNYEKESLEPMKGPFNIQIPSMINDASYVTENGEVYEQLLISNYKALEEYLLNPKGEFVIKVSGKRSRYSEGTEEREGYVEVDITLTDWGVMHSLTPGKNN